jgi:glycosyltransferase involved in cell wall biosynthesis
MAQDKGATHLVDASRQLARSGLDHRLVLVGPELSAFERWFRESRASECDWIEKRGVVPEAEKLALFSEADVFALASRTESFGIVFLEAWAHGLPVVGAGVGALNEVISDGVDGLLTPFGDVDALAAALTRLANDRAFAASLGSAGYEKICRCFTWERVLGRIEGAIHNVLGIEVT